MNRRSFLRRLGLGVAAVPALPMLLTRAAEKAPRAQKAVVASAPGYARVQIGANWTASSATTLNINEAVNKARAMEMVRQSSWYQNLGRDELNALIIYRQTQLQTWAASADRLLRLTPNGVERLDW